VHIVRCDPIRARSLDRTVEAAPVRTLGDPCKGKVIPEMLCGLAEHPVGQRSVGDTPALIPLPPRHVAVQEDIVAEHAVRGKRPRRHRSVKRWITSFDRQPFRNGPVAPPHGGE